MFNFVHSSFERVFYLLMGHTSYEPTVIVNTVHISFEPALALFHESTHGEKEYVCSILNIIVSNKLFTCFGDAGRCNG
jgi:hypothetical protein